MHLEHDEIQCNLENLEGVKSFQTRPGSVSKMHVASNTVLERFWITLESDFEANFEVSA